ncbi:MAG: hypothetical protein SVV67_09890 [Bacillota bacterium]|nr:hypothetical protein [Bacillota bacterium]
MKNVSEEIFSTVDNLMYKDKLKRSRETRREIVGAMLSMLSERDEPDGDFRTCVRDICARMGRHVGLNSEKIADI